MPNKKLENYKVAVLLCDGFEEVEMLKPRNFLQQHGAVVDLISPHTNEVKAWNHDKWGKKYKVNIKLDDANPAEYDLLLLPGGVLNPDKLRTNKQAVKFAKYFLTKKKWLAAICHAPLTLIETNLLKGRKLTSYFSIKTDLKNAGANWVNKKVVVDKKLITSRNPNDISAFNEAILKNLLKGE